VGDGEGAGAPRLAIGRKEPNARSKNQRRRKRITTTAHETVLVCADSIFVHNETRQYPVACSRVALANSGYRSPAVPRVETMHAIYTPRYDQITEMSIQFAHNP
jgi:hypothetical protein